MDINSLVIAQFHRRARPVRMSGLDEDRYYANQAALARVGPKLLGSIAMAAGVILILGAVRI